MGIKVLSRKKHETSSPWETSDGFDSVGYPKIYRRATDAGIGVRLIPFIDIDFSSYPIVDNSSRHAAITVDSVYLETQGDVAGSGYFDGSSSYIAVPTQAGDFAEDFTVEFWTKPLSVTRKGFFSGAGDWHIGVDTIDNMWSMWAGTGSSWDILQADYTGRDDSGRSDVQMTTDWQHIAYVHSGTAYMLFVNGTLALSKIRQGNVDMGQADLYIGMWGNGYDRVLGFMDDFRAYNAAKYTRDFTPPARSV